MPTINYKPKEINVASWPTFSKIRRSFHVVVLQKKAEKCTKNYNALAQLLFCSLNLLSGDLLVAVAVAVAVVIY